MSDTPTSFSDLGLSEALLKAVRDKGYETPSPIQAQAIPAVISGRDVMAAAQTGTGKTAGFTLPLLQRLAGSKGHKVSSNNVRALILTPTRELAAQISESIEMYGKYLNMHSTVVFGGVKINPQMMRLRQGVDVLVATPGRLLDLYNQNAVKFSQLEVFILDEADRMLDMGFIRDIKKLIALLPKDRQNLLFSATFSPDIRALAKGLVNNPLEISVNAENSTAEKVTQWLTSVDKKRKPAVLTHLIQENNWQQVLVFTKTKHGANKLTKHLEAEGLTAAAIHGNKSQGARTKALAAFKDGSVSILVATDIAARGIDIDLLPQVVNFDLPNVPEDYVHRIGRTARAGNTGQALSLVCADELELLWNIEHVIQQHIERKVIDKFIAVNQLGESRPIRPLKAKKAKKPKAFKKEGKGKVEHKDGQRSGANANGNNQSKRRRPSNNDGTAPKSRRAKRPVK
ncbi:DEAD/DEAH box helicase [Colwellia psychrerythraea]|uniref:DEAD-box ATP-dependent RNA helicase RhpA n=1 Tax=Colwellia psychrerythraea TaxID=28229 RepID=A0A099KA84_COLPS|nr:DEAD/DEAH box helicase [Colwellia psychrerythraea]KGJ87185.1 DEAD/DEAH box helicase domain protein [Colwellia psychrerythraea]